MTAGCLDNIPAEKSSSKAIIGQEGTRLVLFGTCCPPHSRVTECGAGAGGWPGLCRPRARRQTSAGRVQTLLIPPGAGLLLSRTPNLLSYLAGAFARLGGGATNPAATPRERLGVGPAGAGRGSEGPMQEDFGVKATRSWCRGRFYPWEMGARCLAPPCC